MRRFVEVEYRCGPWIGQEANTACIQQHCVSYVQMYDHVLNIVILYVGTRQWSFAHVEVWKFGNQADRRGDCCSVNSYNTNASTGRVFWEIPEWEILGNTVLEIKACPVNTGKYRRNFLKVILFL